MVKKALIGAALALVLIGAATATAYTVQIRAGNLIINAEGGFSPTALPKHENAPISLHGGGSLSTASGALPPILKTLTIYFDRHGSVQTTGLPVCTAGRLQSTTVVAARHNCPGSIVGEGRGTAIVAFPESIPFPVSSPITLFNGPKEHGDPTVFAHAYTTVPVPTTFVVPIVIERIHDGVYGYRTEATIPEIAGGSGIPVSGHLRIGRRWTYKGRHYSYVNARCETGHLQAKGEFTFSDGTYLSGSFFRPCTVRR